MLELAQIESFYRKEIRPFKRNILREYLQHKILSSLYRTTHGAKLTFMGGTCIHLVHGSPRFSEDLDFDSADLSPVEFESLAAAIKRDLELEGYDIDLRMRAATALRASFRFQRVLFESGLTGHAHEKLVVQVDAEPQHFAYQVDLPVINKFDVFCRIRAVPVQVLLAQRILCIFTRRRPMGRDFYDAAYLLGKAEPDMRYLEEKLGIPDHGALRERLLERCDALDLKALAADVEPFVPPSSGTQPVLLFRDYVSARL